MYRFALLIALLLLAPPALAQDTPPQEAPPFPEYPDFKPGATHMGSQFYSLALLDLFEIAPAAEGMPARLEGFYRLGGDYTRFYLKGEGEGLAAERVGEAEVQRTFLQRQKIILTTISAKINQV